MSEKPKASFMEGRKPLAAVAETRRERSYEELMKEASELYRGVDFGPKLQQELLWDGLMLVAALRERHYHAIVFVDRGARPIAALLRQVWRRLYPSEAPPVMKFLAGHTPPGSMAAASQVRESFGRAAADFNNKKVLAFDEGRASGSTLTNIREALQQAFPAAEVSGSTYGEFTVGAHQYAEPRALSLFSVLSLKYHDAKILGGVNNPHSLEKVARRSHVQPKYRYGKFKGAAMDETAVFTELSPSNVLSAIGKHEPWQMAGGMSVVDALREAYNRYEDTRTGKADDDYRRSYDRADIEVQLRLACRTILEIPAPETTAPRSEREAFPQAKQRCTQVLHELDQAGG